MQYIYHNYACEHAECVYDAEYIKELLNVCAASSLYKLECEL